MLGAATRLLQTCPINDLFLALEKLHCAIKVNKSANCSSYVKLREWLAFICCSLCSISLQWDPHKGPQQPCGYAFSQFCEHWCYWSGIDKLLAAIGFPPSLCVVWNLILVFFFSGMCLVSCSVLWFDLWPDYRLLHGSVGAGSWCWWRCTFLTAWMYRQH